jgi:hypothetical protein
MLTFAELPARSAVVTRDSASMNQVLNVCERGFCLVWSELGPPE